MKKDNNSDAFSILRQKAEELMKMKPLKGSSLLSEFEALKLVHELEVHQIELELQNEELLMAKAKAAELATGKYAELYDFAPSGYFTLSKEGKIIELNLCGSQMLGKDRMYFKNSWFNSFVAKDARPVFNLFLEKVFNSKAKEACELTLFADGKLPMYVHLTGIATENGTQCLVIAVDITETYMAGKVLKESEERFHLLFDKAPLGYQSLDLDGNFIDVNQQWLDMLGYSREEVIGKWFGDYLSPAYQDGFRKRFSIFKAKGKIYSEFEMIHKDGNKLFIAFEGKISYNLNGEFKQTHCILQDITERKRAEEEILLKNLELQKINAEKDKFFSIIAHDLRSPFNGFLGLTEIMAERLPSMTLDEIQKIAVIMRSSATNLFHLLGNLLEWSRMQRGLTTFVPKLILLLPKISDSMVLVQEAANQKEIEISYTIAADLVVFADGNMLEGIIRNLVTNAVKFTPIGGSVTVSAKTVSDNEVEISIQDTGIGMNKNMIDNLFRLDVNTSRKGTEGELSTGLGLFICKDFIEKHGSKLWVESEEGKGSTFRFTLPAKNERMKN